MSIWVRAGLALAAMVALIAVYDQMADRGARVGGRVADNSGRPISGVPVTLNHAVSGISVTVLTGPDGRFETAIEQPGAHAISISGRIWSASPVNIEVAENHMVAVNLVAAPVENPLTQMPSAYWLSKLPDGEMKREFMVNCTSCHEIAYPRVVMEGEYRTESQWLEAMTYMRDTIDQYKLTPPDFEDARYAGWLAEHLTPDNLNNLPALDPPPAQALSARYTEYPVPERPSLPHDLVVGPHGRIWIAAFFNDEVWALTPGTGEIQAYPVNEKPDTLGQVRALKFGSDGKLRLLLGGTKAVVILDPESGKYETFDAGMYGHSLDLDSAGNVWFNDYFGKPEQIGVVDGKSGALTVHPIPSANLTDAQGLPLPYGLQMDQDDVLWNAALASNQLVRFDTRTGDAKSFEMPTPNSGPRRLAVGPDGTIWIPEWSTGKLAKFNLKTEQFTEYQPGLSTIGPYDVEVNQKTGEVWMSGSLSSSIFRFEPESEVWTEFRWPTEPAYIRHIAVDEETGDVWSAYSSLPEAEPKIVRLQPNG